MLLKSKILTRRLSELLSYAEKGKKLIIQGKAPIVVFLCGAKLRIQGPTH